jgi:hypothetical protein
MLQRFVWLSLLSLAQTKTSGFAFMGGSTTPCASPHEPRCGGVYSTPAWPGARCCAHVWSDSGMAYLWGGYGYDASGDAGYLSDLWELNLTDSTWRHMGGPTQANVPNTPGWPGARHYAAYAHDEAGQGFYLFSGQGVSDDALLDDWWRLDLRTMKWQLLGNSSQAESAPEPRKWANFWGGRDEMFVLGGLVGKGEGGTELNDFWGFSYTTHRWRRIYQREDLCGHYDAAGVQWPGARHNAFTATAADGQLWMFGGSGHGGFLQRGVLSDLWRWNGTQWRFAGGHPGGVEKVGVCAPLGTRSTASLPTARHAGYNFDRPGPDGRMLLFGGEHHDPALKVFNDLWSVELSDHGDWAVEAGDCNVFNVANASTPRPTGVPGADVKPQSVYSGNGWSTPAGDTSWAFGGGPEAGYVSALWRVVWEPPV